VSVLGPGLGRWFIWRPSPFCLESLCWCREQCTDPYTKEYVERRPGLARAAGSSRGCGRLMRSCTGDSGELRAWPCADPTHIPQTAGMPGTGVIGAV